MNQNSSDSGIPRSIQSVRIPLIEFDIPEDAVLPDALAEVRDKDSLFRELDSAYSAGGIDALAWYHPFHLSAHEWGIYIPITSIHYCADRWFNSRLRLSRRSSLALQFLLNHEIIHHACEFAAAQFELFLRASCWAAARYRLKSARLEWFNDEEALANANGVRQFGGSEPRINLDRLHLSLRQSARVQGLPVGAFRRRVPGPHAGGLAP